MTNKTKIDLYREYVRVSDMCDVYNTKHLCNIKPWECVRYYDNHGNVTQEFYSHPKFDSKNKDAYKFAIAILEGRPVFVGDRLWLKGDASNHWIAVEDDLYINQDIMTWTQPTKKRTFTLNSVELPCPIEDNFGCGLDYLGVDYFFESVPDRNKVAQAISNLLTAARDKE